MLTKYKKRGLQSLPLQTFGNDKNECFTKIIIFPDVTSADRKMGCFVGYLITVLNENLTKIMIILQGDHIAQNTQQDSHCSHPTSSRQTGQGNSSGKRKPREDEQEDNHIQMGFQVVKNEQDATELQSQYQKDFPPPSSYHRRRTPALPQPDNIGINPAFR